MSKRSNFALKKSRMKKANTKKIFSKLVHNSQKVDVNRRRRQKFRRKDTPNVGTVIHPDKMKFGAININGLNSETDMAVRDMLEARDFDVNNIKHKALNRNPNRPYEIYFKLSNNLWIFRLLGL